VEVSVAQERGEVQAPQEDADRRILSRDPPNVEAPQSAFAKLITPAEERFSRCHSSVPLLGDDHQIQIAGAVAEPLQIRLVDLRAAPAHTLTVLTECAGNGRVSFPGQIEGEQWSGGAVSTAQWTGAPLRGLLERAGLKETAVEIVFTGADGGDYQRSLPREVALDPDTLLAWEMNGEPIAPQFGGPLRLIVPGWYGMASVKWLARIEAVERPFSGRYQTEKYVYRLGEPVTRVRVKSMFTGLPDLLRARAPACLTGLAWGGEGIARVEVAVGEAWREARMVGPLLPHAWRRFELPWTPEGPGQYLLRCRATDARGETQPDEPVWNEQGYGANGVQQVAVTVR
jgi:DMSO/TMAO reductase YedYZ molybdopterin-dependent catalytic subunit